MSQSDQANVRNRAIGLLARREHSRFELARKLEQKGFEPSDIQPILSELQKENLLSDERYTEAFIHSKINRGQGPLKIRNELTQNGVDEALVERLLSTYEVDWVEQATAARSKRFQGEVPLNYEDKARQARFLSSRGFSTEIIWKVLGDLE